MNIDKRCRSSSHLFSVQISMASEQHQQQFETRDVDKLVERAKTFKEDLDVGKGWTQRLRFPNEYNSWSKTFPEEEVPVKVLSKFENLPIPAAKVAEMLSPSTMETRKKWDKAFAGSKSI